MRAAARGRKPRGTIVDGYIRVSQVAGRSGERFISPVVQREQIEGWAKLHGHVVGRIFEELDESGGLADRPLLMEAIARQESGLAQVLVVAKLDRFGRSLVDGLASIERVTRAGGTVVSVADGLDFSTDTGRLVLRLMLSLAEWELDRVRSGWAAARAKAVERGVHMGPAPLGYRRKRDGRLVIDPAKAELVRELFARRGAGESAGVLAGLLDSRQVPTPTGGVAWNSQTIRSMLANRTYLGEVHHGDLVNPDAHSPIVDRVTWQRAQSPIGVGVSPSTSEPVLLRGIVRCGSCGRVMTTATSGRGTPHAQPHYRCQGRATGGPCPKPLTINATAIEPYVEAVMWGLMSAHPARTAERHVAETGVELAKREGELVAYRDNGQLPARLGDDRFAAGLAVRARRVDRALADVAIAAAVLDCQAPSRDHLRAEWPTMSITDRREVVVSMIDCAVVLPWNHPEGRVWAFARGDAPTGLPRAGPQVMPPPQPWRPGRTQPRATPGRGTLDWTRPKTKRALRTFVAGREAWPPFAAFQSAGSGLLYGNLLRWGTIRSWAKELDLTYEPWPNTLPLWTEDRVRRELRPLLAGRTSWPTQIEFGAMHQNTLRVAASQLGGPERWAAEFGLHYPEHARRRVREWTPERIRTALDELTAGRSEWPTAAEFTAAGLGGLYRKIMETGIRGTEARRLGLTLPEGGYRRAPSRWTEQAIETALTEFMAGRSSWPTRREFYDAHLGGLYHALEGRIGRAAWARRVGTAGSR